MNKIQEAYQTLQAEWVRVNDVQAGDSVRILREHEGRELGSKCCNHSLRYLNDVGREGVIRSIYGDYINVKLASNGNSCCVGFHHLEITDQPRETTIEVRKEDRYYKDGVDVTDQISDETKRNLAN